MYKNFIFSLFCGFLFAFSVLAAEQSPYFTPEEYASISFAPKQGIIDTINSSSFSERVALIKSFRAVQRRRSKLLNKDFSDNKLAINHKNLKNISQMSDFIAHSLDSKEPENFVHLLDMSKIEGSLPDVSEPEEASKPAIETINPEPESDTVKHISVRKKFGQ